MWRLNNTRERESESESESAHSREEKKKLRGKTIAPSRATIQRNKPCLQQIYYIQRKEDVLLQQRSRCVLYIVLVRVSFVFFFFFRRKTFAHIF